MFFGIKENVFAKEIKTETPNVIALKTEVETKDGYFVYELMNDKKLFFS